MEYVGLSGRGLRAIAKSGQEAIGHLKKRFYHFILGTLPLEVQLTPKQIYIGTPTDWTDYTQYSNFQANLIRTLEKNFGFNYNWH